MNKRQLFRLLIKEYEIQNNAIRLINHMEQQLIKFWYDEDETNEVEEDLPF